MDNEFSELGSSSEFNEAIFKMARLNAELEIIAECNRDLMAILQNGKSAIDTKYSSLCNIFSECFAHLSDDKRKEGIEIRKLIQDILDKSEIHIKNPITKKTMINRAEFVDARKILDMFERECRLYMRYAKLDTPTKNESSLF